MTAPCREWETISREGTFKMGRKAAFLQATLGLSCVALLSTVVGGMQYFGVAHAVGTINFKEFHYNGWLDAESVRFYESYAYTDQSYLDVRMQDGTTLRFTFKEDNTRHALKLEEAVANFGNGRQPSIAEVTVQAENYLAKIVAAGMAGKS